MSRHVCRLGGVFAVVSLAAILVSSSTLLHARATLEVIATGLNNPRGLNFGPEGGLYVAEAGSGGAGPCVVIGGSPLPACYGETGAVTRITLGDPVAQERILTGLPSLAVQTGPTPSGSATGPHDVDFQGRGNGFVTMGLGTDPARRDTDATLKAVGDNFGRLIRFQPNGKWSFEEDLAAFEGDKNPDGGAHDSNPYGLLAQPGRQVFTDAGGNALNAVDANGSISNLAVFPNRTVGTATFQAVPTTVTQGPDGQLYVGQLTGFPFLAGAANVYRVPAAGGTPEIYASGFTKIIDIAFAEDGSLYVLQISATAGAPPQGGTGSLHRVPPGGGAPTTIVAPGAGLVAPGGIAIDRDGAIYVTNFSVSPGTGTVVRVVP
jgi:sugar lactone lactonase YvrE